MDRKRIFWGLVFILSAVGLVLSSLGYIGDFRIFSFFLALFFAFIIVKNIGRRNFFGSIFPLAFILIIYSKELGLESITPWTILLAAFLVSLGLSMIFKKKVDFSFHIDREDTRASRVNIVDNSKINLRTSFSESIKYINTDDFERANLDCRFGSMKIYFDNADFKGDRAFVNMDMTCSSLELYLPKAWKIDNRTRPYFGSISEKNYGQGQENKILVLEGDIKFSDVEIIYV